MILRDSPQARLQAAAQLKAGGLIAFRTDTFYGLGVDPFNRESLRALLALKGRDDGKPILVVVSDEREAERFMLRRRTPLFNVVSRKFWPGALTLVVEASRDVPEELTAGTGTIGLRLPADETVRALVRACGGALTATSANPAGEPPARTAKEVAQAFPVGLALIVDGGAVVASKPSSVVDVSGAEAKLIREGAIAWREIQEAVR